MLSSSDSMRLTVSYDPFSDGAREAEQSSEHCLNEQLHTCVFFPLTAAAEGPAPAVEKHQTSPQMTVPASRRLVDADRDPSKSDITDPDPGSDPSSAGP